MRTTVVSSHSFCSDFPRNAYEGVIIDPSTFWAPGKINRTGWVAQRASPSPQGPPAAWRSQSQATEREQPVNAPSEHKPARHWGQADEKLLRQVYERLGGKAELGTTSRLPSSAATGHRARPGPRFFRHSLAPPLIQGHQGLVSVPPASFARHFHLRGVDKSHACLSNVPGGQVTSPRPTFHRG